MSRRGAVAVRAQAIAAARPQLRAARKPSAPVEHDFEREERAAGEGTHHAAGIVRLTAASGAAGEDEADAAAMRATGWRPNSAEGAEESPRASLPPSFTATISAGGEPLSPTLREEFERSFEHDFSRVRIHRDARAERSARELEAQAYTYGEHIAFGRDRFAPHTGEGRALLVHELAHVVQQSLGGHAHLQRRPTRSREPFKKLFALLDQLDPALTGFVAMLKALPTPAEPFKKGAETMAEFAKKMAKMKPEGTRIVDAWVDGKDIPIDTEIDALDWVYDDKPSKKGLARLENYTSNMLALVWLVTPRIQQLSNYSNALGKDAPDEMREAFGAVAVYYMALLPAADMKKVFDDFKFLDTFYRDPRVIQGYGLFMYMRKQLDDIYESLRKSSTPAKTTWNMPDYLASDAEKSTQSAYEKDLQGDIRDKRVAHLRLAFNKIIELKALEESVGELPSTLSEVQTTFDVDANAALIRYFIDLQVRVAILHLWWPIETLQDLLRGTNNAGQSLIPFVGDDRKFWTDELNKLQWEFFDELKKGDHAGIEKKIDDWAARLQPLVDKIPPEVRRKKIIAAIVQQLPFMFVAGATAARIGLWVRAATQSKWLAALAEGATLTAFNAGSIPVGSPGRPKGVAGWTLNLAMNVIFARVGRAFSDWGATFSKGRSVIVQIGTQVVAPTVAMAGLQTGVQLLEAKIKESGGETSLTELFTMNLLMNGIGIVLGAATMQHGGVAKPGGGPGTALAKPVASQLAKNLNISEDQANVLIEILDKYTDFETSAKQVNELLRLGKLTKQQFEDARKQGLDLADFIEKHCEALAKSRAFGDVTAADVKTAIGSLRSKLEAMDFANLTKVRGLLPESTEGLQRVGDSDQWVYDRDHPPTGLAKLRAQYLAAGKAVKELPSGGFEVNDPKTGGMELSVLPANSQAIARIGKNLNAIATGELASKGLAKVREQKAVARGMLEAQLQQAAGGAKGDSSVARILRHLASFIDSANDIAWVGLSRFLSFGGDAALLARAMAYGASKEFSAESRDLANKLLSQMAEWGPDAFDGFKKLYEVRPDLTAERLHTLLGDFEPHQVKGILESIGLLAPRSKNLRSVIGPLTSGARSSEIGALGSLTAGVEMAEKYIDATLVFEDPITSPDGEIVRVTDISVQEQRTTRVAGVTKTETVEIAAVEVKEVSTESLGKRAPQELARDISRDAAVRAKRLAPAKGSRPFFETFTWRIRGKEIRQKAIDQLKNPSAKEAEIETRMREIVQKQLEKALERPEFKKLSPDEQDGYRNAFKGLPFVTFY